MEESVNWQDISVSQNRDQGNKPHFMVTLLNMVCSKDVLEMLATK